MFSLLNLIPFGVSMYSWCNRAASMKPECSCIWKLMGDACTMLFPMPPSLGPFTLPAKLVHREIQDLDEVVEVTKLQVLQMGTR